MQSASFFQSKCIVRIERPHAPDFATKEEAFNAIRTHQSRGTASADAACAKGRARKRPESSKRSSLRNRGFAKVFFLYFFRLASFFSHFFPFSLYSSPSSSSQPGHSYALLAPSGSLAITSACIWAPGPPTARAIAAKALRL